ncbi:MAG TPA: asparagine synthase (glutamine-hydrolyzing) [bacterium]|nr:asparagine synthase (glutamine-hydrolyzing) [bacterium]HPN31614.1 asparagine synthase (glutamine-hydrolyzing) [bacterium]
MCGICGLIEIQNRTPEKKTLLKMTDVIEHRGPDDSGIFIRNNVGFGHRRLSILDLSEAGRQPFISEDKEKILVFNGEIYNFLELKKNLESKGIKFYSNCDTEVLLKTYETFGIGCLGLLRGMFSFAIYDFKNETLFAARDRLGKKPFYYSMQNGVFYFASEIKSILQDSRFIRKPDFEAIHHYLSFKYVPHPFSAFEDVKKLPHGHYLIYQNGKIKIEKYWDALFKKEKISDINYIKSELKRLLTESVKLRMISDVPLGAFLSGGIDSNIIVGLMSELSPVPVKTFSIGFEEKRFNESHFAEQVAKRFNTDHHTFIVKSDIINDMEKLVWHYNEPFADTSMLPTFYLSRETRKYVTVALSGDAGDENFAGYLRYLGFKLGSMFEFIPEKIRKSIFGTMLKMIPASSKQQTKYNKFYRLIEAAGNNKIDRYMPMIEDFNSILKKKFYTGAFSEKIRGIESKKIIEKYFCEMNEDAGADDIGRLLYTDLNTYLPDDIMTKVDIASMAVSLECRAPFMDHLVVEFASSIPSSLKLKCRNAKYILKETFKDYIPSNLINREKMGFTVPISEWFRKDLKNYMNDLISEKFYKRNIFDKTQIERMKKAHLECREEHGYKLWNLVCLELWFRKFID